MPTASPSAPPRSLSEFRLRTVWDVVDDAVDWYRGHFVLFAGIAAVSLAPYHLAESLWSLRFLGPDGSGNDSAGGEVAYTLLTAAAYAVASVVQTAATALAMEDRLSGRPTSLARVFGQLTRQIGTLGGATVLYLIWAALGVLAFLVGYFVVMTRYAFFVQTIVLEKQPARSAGRRSRDLAKHNTGKVFGLIMLMILVSLLLWAGVSSLLEAVFYLVPFAKAEDVAAQQMREFMAEQVALSLTDLAVAPVAPIAMTLLYYDLRVRHEGLDIEAQAAAVGYALAQDPFLPQAASEPRLPGAKG